MLQSVHNQGMRERDIPAGSEMRPAIKAPFQQSAGSARMPSAAGSIGMARMLSAIAFARHSRMNPKRRKNSLSIFFEARSEPEPRLPQSAPQILTRARLSEVDPVLIQEHG